MTTEDSNPTNWWHYIERGLENVGINQTRLADEIGISRPSLSRWRTQGVIPNDPEIIRDIADVLQTSVADALEALGYLDEDEAAQMRGEAQLDNYTNRQLLDEIERRMKDRQ